MSVQVWGGLPLGASKKQTGVSNADPSCCCCFVERVVETEAVALVDYRMAACWSDDQVDAVAVDVVAVAAAPPVVPRTFGCPDCPLVDGGSLAWSRWKVLLPGCFTLQDAG
jgi:hypothetical protein